MNITVCSHYFVPEIGAPSARIYDLAREWIAAGHSVQVVTCFPNHPHGTIYPPYRQSAFLRETIDGIGVVRLWSYVTPNRGVIKRTLGHLSFMASAMLLSRRKSGPADVVIGTSPTLFAAVAAARMAKRRGVPFVMEVRDLWPASFSELGVLRNRTLLGILERLELSLYRRAAGVVTVTEAFRQNLIARGVPPEKVCTIPNGADLAFWQPRLADPQRWRRQLGLGDGRFVVLYIGAHGISQRLSTVLRAAARLRGDRSIVFVLVGEGAEKAMLIEEAKAAALDNVVFVEPTDKAGVRDFYAAADVCLVPLRDIPLFSTFIPSKMFEVMAMGRPIVASVRGESAEILERSGGALVVPPEDDAAIAEAIVKVRDGKGPDGARGRAFVEASYSRVHLAARYAEFLERTRSGA
jgi:glycosyltransferase involved in cell wall biosynthesis